MKHTIAALLFTAGLLATAPARPLPPTHNFTDVAEVTAGRHAGWTSVSVVAKPGWHLNTAAPLRLTLGDRRLGLKEAQLRAPEPDKNSAVGASWSVEEVHVSEGTLRAAFCTPRQCLPPFTQTFPIRGGGGR